MENKQDEESENEKNKTFQDDVKMKLLSFTDPKVSLRKLKSKGEFVSKF